MIKKIEDYDYYEILNLKSGASPKDIEDAYLMAVATYHEDSLASYGVLLDKDRAVILDKVEAAFETLSNPKKREDYDARVRDEGPVIPEKAAFRRSTSRLLIEDASERKTLWKKIKTLFSPVGRRADAKIPGEGGDGRKRPGSAGDFYYYGEFLKRVRQRRGLTLEDIARKCEVDPLELRSLEDEIPGQRGNGGKDLDVLRCYAKCLGLDPENGRNSSSPARFH